MDIYHSVFLGECSNTSDMALSMSATLEPWCTFKLASVKEEKIEMGSRMLHRI